MLVNILRCGGIISCPTPSVKMLRCIENGQSFASLVHHRLDTARPGTPCLVMEAKVDRPDHGVCKVAGLVEAIVEILFEVDYPSTGRMPSSRL